MYACGVFRLCSVQAAVAAGVSRQQTATEGSALSSNMSVRSAAAAAEVYPDASLSSSSSTLDRRRSGHTVDSPDIAALWCRYLGLSTCASAVALLATQFAARSL